MTTAALRRYAAYQPCDAGWIGMVPSHWKTKRLKYAASCNDDVLRETTAPDTLLHYVDISSVSQDRGIERVEEIAFDEAPSRARRRVREGDTLLSTVRTYLKAVAHIGSETSHITASTGFAVIRPRREIQSRYLSYQVQSEPFVAEVVRRSVGVSYPAINASEVMNFVVALPPLDEQHAIAFFLDRETARIDALIQKKRRLIELLQEKRAAALTEFVLAGKYRSGTKVDSGKTQIGAIPSHWSVKRLKHVSPRLMVGVVVNPSSFVADTGKPFLLGSNIKEGRILWQEAARIDEAGNQANAKSILRKGDLVTVRVGAPGVTAVVPEEADGGNAASVMIIRGHRSFDSQWLCHVMNSRVVRSQIEIVQYGAAQEQFNIGHAVDFWVPVPPIDEQRAIASLLDEKLRTIDDLMDRLRRTIQASSDYRSALIAAAVTGQIDVRAAA